MLKLLELFSGVGTQTQALKNIGVEHEVVGISDIDEFCNINYEKLHGQKPQLGDITKIKHLPECDILTYSFPCQDISVAGAQAGFNKDTQTRSGLLWEVERLLIDYKNRNMLPTYLVLENVKNLSGEKFIDGFLDYLKALDALGYNSYWTVLNAVDFGIPQNRERVFAVSILKEKDKGYIFPKGIKTPVKLTDILEDHNSVPENMWMNKPYIPRETVEQSDAGLMHVGNLDMAANETIKRVYSPEGVCPTLTTMQGGHRQPKIYVEGRGVRKLTPRECWKLMGFTDEQFDLVKDSSNTQLYKQAGNAIVINVLQEVFREMLKDYNN